MIDELAPLLLGLPFNLRPSDESNGMISFIRRCVSTSEEVLCIHPRWLRLGLSLPGTMGVRHLSRTRLVRFFTAVRNKLRRIYSEGSEEWQSSPPRRHLMRLVILFHDPHEFTLRRPLQHKYDA